MNHDKGNRNSIFPHVCDHENLNLLLLETHILVSYNESKYVIWPNLSS